MNNTQELNAAEPTGELLREGISSGTPRVAMEGPEEKMSEPEMDQPKEWRPTHSQALREHEINIRFLNRGCIVRVGCKEIAFEDVHQAMREINEYVNYPWDVQQKWRKILD
jgi:hypothetical protein